MILSWGWYPDRLCPNPEPARVREDFARLRSLGYNGVKLCLWFPPPFYFDIADEEGMLLWVELPMWLPDPDPFFRQQTPAEYARLVAMARNHPSVILYSLGCELNRAVGPEILAPLYELVKREGGGALVRDNSGSGEAYGGLLNEFADYYDYHFYCELPFFRPLVESFNPRWRPQQPWIFGEFCDYDTFRDLRRAQKAAGSGQNLLEESDPARDTRPAALPFWLNRDPRINPQGARWQFDTPFLEERLRASGLWNRGTELERFSHLHALLHRKWTLELCRTYREIGGYVVTGEADTPISTAGMWDDSGTLKFDPPAFRAFNQDLVLALGWDKRRAWVHGGDRVAPYDTFSYRQGALVRPHLILSHYGASTGPVSLEWSIAFDNDPPFASGAAVTPFALAPGDVRELTVAEFLAPQLRAPRRATLHATAAIGSQTTTNDWPLWFFPRSTSDNLTAALHDPTGKLADLTRIAPGISAIQASDLQPSTFNVQPPPNAQPSTFNLQPPPNAQPSTLNLHPTLNAQPSTLNLHPTLKRSTLNAPTLNAPTPQHPARNVQHPNVQRPVLISTSWSPEIDRYVNSGGRCLLIQSGEGSPGPIPTVALPFWREALRLCEPHPAWGDFPHDGWAALQFFGCATDHALDTAGLINMRPILRRVDTRSAAIHDYACELAWGEGHLIITTLRFEGGAGEQPLGISRNTAAAELLARWVHWLADML
jgi:hypothetical protein